MNIYKYVCGSKSPLSKVTNANTAKALVKTQYTQGGSRQSLKVFGSKRMRSL